MSVKSTTCFGKKTGKPLTEYLTQQEAQEGADHVNGSYGNKLVPYPCRECGMWHLSPSDRQTPSTKCSHCTGKNGNAKDSYQSCEDAQRRADILRKEQGASLSVYACEHGNGWHLTRDTRS